jgi:NADPH:quinone reductase-like Zn-dependent oxidoreductase
VVLGASQADRASLDIRSFYFGQYDILGTTMGSLQDFDGLLKLMRSENLHPPVVDRIYPLDEAATAHSYLELGMNFGKIVLSTGVDR